MKSSLAQTFKDASTGEASHDRIFKGRKTVRKITDEAGAEIVGERVLVVLPYDEEFGPTEKTSTLLVDAKLRKEYEQLHVEIDEAKDALLKSLRQQANSKKDFEHEIASAFTSGDDFETATNRIRVELEKQTRLVAERFMIEKIKDDKFVGGIKFNQTQALISKFKTKCPTEVVAIGCLDRVALMTPENIHVNSFMYEPIVDMSDEHLKRLYRDAKKLS